MTNYAALLDPADSLLPNDDNCRPDYLPEKFWDPEKKEPRTESLARSYGELEKRFSAVGDIPSDPSGYEIKPPSEFLHNSDEVNERLHKAGFSKTQAQTVYDMAGEVLMPMVMDIAGQINRQDASRRLSEHFGGEDKWHEVSHQIRNWASKKLPETVIDAMSSSYEGVLALHAMMKGNEPSLSGGDTFTEQENEEGLRKLMADPRYWRDRDPALVNRVRKGFERIYPDKG